MEYNTRSLDTLAGALSEILGIDPPAQAAPAAKELTDYAAKAFHGRKADRIFMYNPDAVAQWVEDTYPSLMEEVDSLAPLRMPFLSVMPSVTPVCFGTMYTGTQPEVHGIRAYAKPVIRTDSLFDAAIRAGKRCAIVAETGCSMSMIYLEREMDYFIYDSIAEVNAKACELILEDKYDLLAVYNGNYDHFMHREGPEAVKPLAELRCNVHAFAQFAALIRTHWQEHDVLLGFAMDHGCHEIDGSLGSHGLDMPEDLNIRHHYAALPKKAP